MGMCSTANARQQSTILYYGVVQSLCGCARNWWAPVSVGIQCYWSSGSVYWNLKIPDYYGG